MLNVKDFYANYGLKLGALQHAIVNGYEVLVNEYSIIIISPELNQDPFVWLAYNFEGIVFVTKSDRLSMILIFDDEEEDETLKGVVATNRLIGLVQ